MSDPDEPEDEDTELETDVVAAFLLLLPQALLPIQRVSAKQ
jgi:hypothetical protein